MDIIKNIKGTKDIYGDEAYVWQFVESKIHQFIQSYGYDEIRTPKFEKSGLFNRSIGQDTDIVSKEMYSWVDQGNNELTLKPEVTASVVRAYIQHNLGKKNSINKFYYIDSLFRRERPQKGRFRQFEQYGIEAIGSDNPEQDAEVISIAYHFYKFIGIKKITLKINSIGSKKARDNYKIALKEYLKPFIKNLSEISQRRFETNPLRILDTKIDFEQEILKDAPKIVDFLSDKDSDHFKKVLFYLKQLKIDYVIDNYLVRGLDYYSRTVFEIESSNLGSQSALCGGGRYDYLVEELGGPPTPAIGFAAGIERLILALNIEENQYRKTPDIYMVSLGDDAISYSLNYAITLRLGKNLKVICDMLQKSLKAQMKEANKLKCKYVIIIGENEIANKTAVIKNMISGEQEKIKFDKIITYFN